MIDTSKTPYVLPVLFEEGDPNVRYRWLDCFPNYAIGDDGSVWTCWKEYSRNYQPQQSIGHWRRCHASLMAGYPAVYIRTIRKQLLIHRLVLTAFCGPAPDGHEGCHNDGNKDNAALSNLRWDTHGSNMRDSAIHGTSLRGVRSRNTTLTESDVVAIRIRYATTKESSEVIGKDYGMSGQGVIAIVNGRTWPHVGGPLNSSDAHCRKIPYAIPDVVAVSAMKMIQSGVSVQRAAKNLGCVPRTLREALRRKGLISPVHPRRTGVL